MWVKPRSLIRLIILLSKVSGGLSLMMQDIQQPNNSFTSFQVQALRQYSFILSNYYNCFHWLLFLI